MRRFFGSLSSFSLSLASLLVPATLPPVALLGVSGGVVIGTPVTLPELAAAMPGTLPEMRVGLLTTPTAGTVEVCVACVAMEDVELDRAGDDGRWEKVVVVAGGDGAVKELDELRCWWCEPLGNGDGGAKAVVGVGVGVFWFDEVPAVVLFVLAAPTSPL